ncbi:hypothetical protein J5N97_025889 [Dioscorea zingiberensis]|uniref:Endonuclease/exonuclease/phosphatase domain-containing protein n=1 Tax=Dioscorea zingiberensis TaxID=325984 RepID=A0A9D5C1E2_9LILI|nr:hypothetical protein J5N97_025889 [Dioscorea zingiberensis]
MEERMEAIGNLVNQYSPDIIFFQLSKLRVENFMSKPFLKSSMGREICAAEIDVGSNKTLVVATSHLESLPPNSEKRVFQAKEALRFLEQFPNVIFGGDMNWDEYTDDDFPLGGDWTDAWAKLKGEPGWTYDTKSNTMLKGNRPLQKRLDRFICKLEDFRMMNVEMIGNEAIPDLSYRKNQKMVLPVFPSDHYGLILTISSNV